MTIDAGLKSLYKDGARPRIITPGYQGLQYDWFGDEHGRLSYDEQANRPQLGTVLALIVSHCDPTVNQFDHYHVTQDDRVVDIWPIDLRGKSQ